VNGVPKTVCSKAVFSRERTSVGAADMSALCQQVALLDRLTGAGKHRSENVEFGCYALPG